MGKLHSIKNYILNIYRYLKKGGFKSGGIVYVQCVNIEDCELLAGKKVLITGGTTGIGFAIAKRCCEAGASVIITGRSEKKLLEACEKLELNVKYHVQDMRDTNEKVIKQHLEEIGEIDLLVNNAGVCPVTEYLNCSEQIYDETIDTNLKGGYFLTQEIIRGWIDDKRKGTIVNVASNSGLVGLSTPYCLSKHGVIALTEGIAKEFYEQGIRCNAIAPDVTISNITSLSRKYNPEGNLYDSYVKHKRVFRAEEVAEVALFLLSDRSVCINGQTIACDNAGSLAENTVG